MLPLGSVLGEDAALQTSTPKPYKLALYTTPATTTLLRGLHIPKHRWIIQNSIQFFDLCQERQKYTCWHQL